MAALSREWIKLYDEDFAIAAVAVWISRGAIRSLFRW